MTNVFKKVADFWIGVWRKTKDRAVSLWHKTMDLGKSFAERVVGIKNKIVNNKLIPTALQKCREFAAYADENRKVCYPVILVVYTVVVVVVTLSIVFGIVLNNDMAQQAGQLAGDIAATDTYPTMVYLEKGQPLSVDGEFTICYDGYKFDKKITPSKAEKFGAYYENHSEGNLYFDVMLTYTNTSQRALSGDEIVRAVANCAGVAYNCFVAVETEQGTNFEFAGDAEISPGESVNVHCIFDVPSSMKNTSHDVNVEVTTDNKTYYIDVR